MPYLTTADDTRLFYFDVGSGPAIVWSHAWALNSDQFHYLVNDLVDAGYRCIGFDRRGHGRSDRPGTGMTLDGFADDLAFLLDALDLDDVTLAGHSLGCSEIVRCATRHGLARVARAMLLAPIMPLLVARKLAAGIIKVEKVVHSGLKPPGGKIANDLLFRVSQCELLPQKLTGTSLLVILQKL